MNETIAEWLRKARLDRATARRELATVEEPNFDAVCFHSQQCIEKTLKAVLVLRGVMPPKTHDLAVLNRLFSEAVPGWSWPVEDLRFLTRAAVDFRYPGESADPAEAREAYEIAERLHQALLNMLGSTEDPDDA